MTTISKTAVPVVPKKVEQKKEEKKDSNAQRLLNTQLRNSRQSFLHNKVESDTDDSDSESDEEIGSVMIKAPKKKDKHSLYECLAESQAQVLSAHKKMFKIKSEFDRLETQNHYQKLDMSNSEVEKDLLKVRVVEQQEKIRKYNCEKWSSRIYMAMTVPIMISLTVMNMMYCGK